MRQDFIGILSFITLNHCSSTSIQSIKDECKIDEDSRWYVQMLECCSFCPLELLKLMRNRAVCRPSHCSTSECLVAVSNALEGGFLPLGRSLSAPVLIA